MYFILNKFLEPQFTWWEFLLIGGFLVLLYFGMIFFEKILGKFSLFGKYQIHIENAIDYIILIYEAIVLLVLGGVFVLISPIIHGIIALVLITASFAQIKNYFSGRFLLLDKTISKGIKMQSADSQGVVSKVGRLGIKLRTKVGLQYINYFALISQGYTILSGDEIGGLYQLNIKPNDPDDKINYTTQLTDLLNTTPYLDWSHKPQISPQKDISKTLEATVMVKEESHLRDLVALINEWGFQCIVVS